MNFLKSHFNLKFRREEMLHNCDKNTPEFSLEGKIKLCKVVDVYDGDTCKVVFNLGNKVNKWSIRMAGYDSPEMRPSKKNENRDEEIKAAQEARDYLKGLVQKDNQLVYIKCGEFDKYGRLLGTLYLHKNDAKSVNQMMIDNNHGYAYNGGTRREFSS